MKASNFSFTRSLCALAISGVLFLPLTLSAQDVEPTRWTLRIVSVKSDSTAAFEAGLRDVAAIQQEAGRLLFHVYERARGSLDTYTIITQDDAFVDQEPAPLPPELVDRLVHAEDHTTLLSVGFYEDLGIAGESLHPPGEYMRVRLRTVSPANADDYHAWHRDQLTPALREAGLTDLRAGRIMLGGNTNTFFRYVYSDSIGGEAAGLDIPGTVGQREFGRILEREAQLLSNSEDLMLRFREDLSFTAQP